MKRRILIVLGILVLAGGLGAGGWYYMQNRTTASKSDEVAYVSTISSITGISTGVTNRYAGVVEPQETVDVKIESGRKVSEVQVKVGDQVKKGQLLFEYNLSSIQEDLQEAQLDLERLKNEALSLEEQIKTLESEKKKASRDNQLSYTIEIESNRMNLKKNEYDQKSKTAEIERLQSATGNTEVRSEIDGIIQKIDSSKMESEDGDVLDSSNDYYGADSSENEAFITILSTGAYRVKGTVNELNTSSIVTGEPVIIRSRVDDSLIWKGTMGSIDRENATTGDSSSSYFGMMESTDEQTSSSTYPFYVELESSDGLMLGQHVFIELDEGQEDQKDGIWISDYYIVGLDTSDPYVWAADADGKLEKRKVVLGNHDEELEEYEIVEGLSLEDSIAYPAENLQEGMNTAVGNGYNMIDESGEADMEEPEILDEGASYEEEGDYSLDGLEMGAYEDDSYEDDSYEMDAEAYTDEGDYEDAYIEDDMGDIELYDEEDVDMEDPDMAAVSEDMMIEDISEGEALE